MPHKHLRDASHGKKISKKIAIFCAEGFSLCLFDNRRRTEGTVILLGFSSDASQRARSPPFVPPGAGFIAPATAYFRNKLFVSTSST